MLGDFIVTVYLNANGTVSARMEDVSGADAA
jgi:hypothetical protein